MKYFLLAGEASGDLHGANLAKAIFNQDKEAEIVGWGGDKMVKANVNVIKHYDQLAIMGFVEVLSKLSTIFQNLKQGVHFVNKFQPDAVILIDFSGFNLRLAKRLRKNGYKGKIFYYISPKLWIWNSARVKSIKKYIDVVFCILPFEVEFYNMHGYHQAFYIGNPIMDEIVEFTPNENFRVKNDLSDEPIIALLPGSREKEVRLILPEMLALVQHFPNYQFVVAGVKSLSKTMECSLRVAGVSLPIIYNQTYDVLYQAQAAAITSGTATLEAALLKSPFFICYKGNQLSYLIAKAMVNIDYIGLPNLIMNKEIVKEFIQGDCTVDEMKVELHQLLHNDIKRSTLSNQYDKLQDRVGRAGASNKAARLMYQKLNAQ